MAATPPTAEAATGGGAADPTLLETLQALSPEDRLRWNDRMATTILELRHGFDALDPDHAAGPAGGQRR